VQCQGAAHSQSRTQYCQIRSRCDAAVKSQYATGGVLKMPDFEWETWLIETGAEVVEVKAKSGLDSLSDAQHLLYCLWVADYGMTNAGDLATAHDLYPAFQAEAMKLATKLNLPISAAAFGLPRKQLEKAYFDKFEAMCREIAPLLGYKEAAEERAKSKLAVLIAKFPGDEAWRAFAESREAEATDVLAVASKVVGTDHLNWLNRKIPAFDGHTPLDVLQNAPSGDVALKCLLMKISQLP
jgi:hypothetical protein